MQRHSRINDLDPFLEETGTQAFLVIIGDDIVYERYMNGYTRDSIVTSFSTAKSVLSALIGIAVHEGQIHSISDPITKYIPELAARDSRFAQITIEHLLSMSSGIKYHEVDFLHGDNARIYFDPDLRNVALQETFVEYEPGVRFEYNNFHPLLLGLILERSTDQSVTSLLQQKIWTPMGAEYDGSWSLDSEAGGLEKLESGLNARAVDFARFGWLFLHKGARNDQHVIPSAWVEASTQPRDKRIKEYYPESYKFDGGHVYYKHMWWGLQRDSGESDFAAMGNLGQYIFVSPRSDLVVVRNGIRHGVGDFTWLGIFHHLANSLSGESEAAESEEADNK